MTNQFEWNNGEYHRTSGKRYGITFKRRLTKASSWSESSSPYASLIVLFRKNDGNLRVCVDYRLLNAKTHKDAYPLPRIDKALDVLKGAKHFCSLDLAHGFSQIPMEESDIKKTAFKTGTGGLYEYTRMPFGLWLAVGVLYRVFQINGQDAW